MCFAKYLESYWAEFHQIFRVLAGSPCDFESLKISVSGEGLLREGLEKKFDPHFLFPRGPEAPNFLDMGSP